MGEGGGNKVTALTSFITFLNMTLNAIKLRDFSEVCLVRTSYDILLFAKPLFLNLLILPFLITKKKTVFYNDFTFLCHLAFLHWF